MVKSRKYVVKNYFKGIPKRDDYEVVESELPSLKDNEILVKVEYLSVDPYQRAYNVRFPLPYDQFGYNVGVVQETTDPNYPVGTRVVSRKGWIDNVIISTVPSKEPYNLLYKLPDLQGLPPSLGLGAVGIPGATAYFGFLEICQPKAGETVVVTGAAGAVGFIVGQIAKIKGCRVIGIAGSDDKVKWLEQDLGFDKAINYKTADIDKELKAAAPKGVDCYFDNVGGELSSKVLYQMNVHGRVSICGSISSYNDDPSSLANATIVQNALVFSQLKMEGFLVWRWIGKWEEAYNNLIMWIKSGQLKTREHVTEGFDNVFDAFIGMLAGDNFGKALVKV